MAFCLKNSIFILTKSTASVNSRIPILQEPWGLIRNSFLRPSRANSNAFRTSNSGQKFGSLPSELHHQQSNFSPRSLWKPLIFTIGFTSTTFVGCSIWQYETVRKTIIDQSGLKFNGWIKKRKSTEWRQRCNDVWNNLSDGQKIFAPVLFANLLVFAAWKVPKFQPVMLKWFASNPAARVVCWPMFLSTFSHYSLFHFAANMYVLHSFTPAVVGAVGQEQATFLYLSAGVISSFASYFHKVVAHIPGLSIGASGAIMGVLGYVCTQFPDTRLQIIFLPMFTFTAGAALKFVLGMDLAGVVLGWKFFDHAAHLGGALTGVFWSLYGYELLWRNNGFVVRQWHKMRTSEV